MVFITGTLLALSFFSQMDGTGVHRQRGILTVIITGIICVCLLILATSKLWFTHLWKKNSSHDRHRQHTRHHPMVKNQEYLKRR